MPKPHQIAAETTEQLVAEVAGLSNLSAADREKVRQIINRAVVRQLARDIWQVWNHDGPDLRDALLELIDARHFNRDEHGRPITSNLNTPHWREWFPGLDNDAITLDEVLRTLPGFAADEVPQLVRLFENPSSPIALAGAVTLEQHDAIHVLIGRGLVDQDEAFTIGFTARASKVDLAEAEKQAYRVALQSYGEPYRIHGRDLLAFDLGVKAANFCSCDRLDTIDVAQLRGQKLGPLRRRLGIDVDVLREFYSIEQAMIPGTPASLRLPVV